MPTVELEQSGGATSEPYASVDDVRNQLGTLRDRLPAFVDVATFLAIGHAEIVDRLAGAYPNGIPTFAGTGLEVVRYAEAKVAAAEILEAIRVNLPDLGDAPDRLRSSAYTAVDNGVVGYPAGSTDLEGETTPSGRTSVPGPRVSSFTPLSAFPDPYGEARSSARFE